jgi:hypothetical protein
MEPRQIATEPNVYLHAETDHAVEALVSIERAAAVASRQRNTPDVLRKNKRDLLQGLDILASVLNMEETQFVSVLPATNDGRKRQKRTKAGSRDNPCGRESQRKPGASTLSTSESHDKKKLNANGKLEEIFNSYADPTTNMMDPLQLR